MSNFVYSNSSPQAENKKLKGELEKLRLVEKKSERESCGSETQIVEEQTKPSFVQVNKGELNELKTTYCK